MKAQTHIIVLCESNLTLDNTHTILQKQIHDSIDPIEKTVCISFENQNSKNTLAQQLKEKHPQIELITLGNLHILGLLSITHAARQLKKILDSYDSYQIIAHGALAGLICKRAVQPLKCESLTIKAYGLLAAEYDYCTNQKRSLPERLLHGIKTAYYRSIEKKTYQSSHNLIPVQIDTQSNALREFIFNTFHADYKTLTVMPHTIHHTMSPETRNGWKNEIRQELNIPPFAQLYCYQGNFKPTEFAQESLEFFKQQQMHNNQSYLLIMSSEKDHFDAALARLKIPVDSYRIINPAVQEKQRYLAACDIGIVLKDHHIIHWISKPSIAIEYLEAGMQLAHNNTIAWLAKENPQAESFIESIDKMAQAYDKKMLNNEAPL